MYVIIDFSTDKVYQHDGDFMDDFIASLVKEGHEITVVSTHSKSIKYGFKYHRPKYAGDWEGAICTSEIKL